MVPRRTSTIHITSMELFESVRFMRVCVFAYKGVPPWRNTALG